MNTKRLPLAAIVALSISMGGAVPAYAADLSPIFDVGVVQAGSSATIKPLDNDGNAEWVRLTLVDDTKMTQVTELTDNSGTYVVNPDTLEVTFTPASGFTGNGNEISYVGTTKGGETVQSTLQFEVVAPQKNASDPVAYSDGALIKASGGTYDVLRNDQITAPNTTWNEIFLIDSNGEEVKEIVGYNGVIRVDGLKIHAEADDHKSSGIIGPVTYRAYDSNGNYADASVEFAVFPDFSEPTPTPEPAPTPTPTPTPEPTPTPTPTPEPAPTPVEETPEPTTPEPVTEETAPEDAVEAPETEDDPAEDVTSPVVTDPIVEETPESKPVVEETPDTETEENAPAPVVSKPETVETTKPAESPVDAPEDTVKEDTSAPDVSNSEDAVNDDSNTVEDTTPVAEDSTSVEEDGVGNVTDVDDAQVEETVVTPAVSDDTSTSSEDLAPAVTVEATPEGQYAPVSKVTSDIVVKDSAELESSFNAQNNLNVANVDSVDSADLTSDTTVEDVTVDDAPAENEAAVFVPTGNTASFWSLVGLGSAFSIGGLGLIAARRFKKN